MKLIFKEIRFLLLLFLLVSASSHASFVENKGQLKDTKGNKCNSIKAYTKNLPVNVYIHKDGSLSFVLNQFEQKVKNHDVYIDKQNKTNLIQYRLDLKFISNLVPKIELGEKQDFYDHFYLENEKYEYLYNYQTVFLKNIYKNIDLKIKIDNGKIKYDFIVHPGGNPSDIKYYFDGGLETKLNTDGSILIKTELGDLFDSKPVSFQEDVEIESNYKIENNIISYQIGNFNKSKTLIIDPIIWSTYLGGGSIDISMAIDRDATLVKKNNQTLTEYSNYICGKTSSYDFPYTIGNFSSSNLEAGFISKYDEINGTLKYTVYYRQLNSSITFNDLQVVGLTAARSYYTFSHQPNKKIIICGVKTELYYPDSRTGIIGSFEASTGVINYLQFKGGCTFRKLSKVSFGNNSYDKVYLTGHVSDENKNIFSRTNNAHQPNYGGGINDAILVKVKVSDGATLYSSFLGGNNDDMGLALDIFKNPNSNNEIVIVSGYTNSTMGIASANAFDPTPNGATDVFLTRFNFNTNASNVNNETFNSQSWSTYFGGNQDEIVSDIKIDEEGAIQTNNPAFQIHIVGRSYGNLPLYGQPFQSTFGGGTTDGFLATFSLFNGGCSYSTYLGGNANEQINTVKPFRYYGNYYIELLGRTQSSNFSITSNAFKLNQTGNTDGFITVLKSNNLNGPFVNQLFYSTYFGGDFDDDEMIMDVAKTSLYSPGTNDTVGTISFTGYSNSFNYPVLAGSSSTTIAQPNCAGYSDAIITRFRYMDAARPVNEEIQYVKDNLLSEITIYPNPASDIMYISEVLKDDIVQIYDVSGRNIFNKKIHTDEINFQINLDNFQSGYYRISITNNFKSYSNAFIKK